MPEGCKLVGRWHAPGSGHGFLLAETNDPAHIYEHASEWGEMISWTTTPVLTDQQAGPICQKIWAPKSATTSTAAVETDEETSPTATQATTEVPAAPATE